MRRTYSLREVEVLLRLAVERARATTRENMCDEAIVEFVLRSRDPRFSLGAVEISGPPQMETR